jgi:hypothetical protein
VSTPSDGRSRSVMSAIAPSAPKVMSDETLNHRLGLS